jgi:hypothetical protein
MYWHPPWVWLTFLAGALIYVVVALVVRKSATVHVGLCEKHRSRRRMGMLVGWLGVLATIATCSVGMEHEPAAAAGLGFLGFIVFLIVGIVLAQAVQPKKIDELYAWVKCGRPFVDSLPPSGPPQPRW